MDEPFTVFGTSKKVPNQLRACCSVTIAVTVTTLQEFAINPSSSTIIERLFLFFIYIIIFYLHSPFSEWIHKEQGKVRNKEKPMQTVWEGHFEN